MEKNRIENLLKRFLKRKVKITLGLMIAFMITGTVGYASIEGSLEANKDGDINYKLTTTKEENIISTTKNTGDKILEAKENINLELDANYNVNDDRRSVGGISTKEATTNLIAGKNITLNLKNSGITKVVGIGKRNTGNNATTNLNSMNGDISLNIEALTASRGIGTQKSTENVNLTAEKGDISISVKTSKGEIGKVTSGIYNIGTVTLEGNDILISTSANKDMSEGVLSDEGGKTTLDAKGKVEIISVSAENTSLGINSRKYFGSKGENIINGNEIIVNVLANSDKIPSSNSEKINIAHAMYSEGGKNQLTAVNGITLKAVGRDASYGIDGRYSSQQILKSKIGDINIDSTSTMGESRGIHSLSNSSIDITSGNNTTVNSIGRETSYGVYGADSDINLTSNSGNIVITSQSKENTSYGLCLSNSDVDITSGNNIAVSSIGKGNSYGIASFNGNADLYMKANEKITSYAKSETGVSYGAYITGKEANILGKEINITSEGEKEAYGIYGANSNVNLTSNLGNIVISSKKEGEKIGEDFKESTGIFADNNSKINLKTAKESIAIYSEDVGNKAYGIYSKTGAVTTIDSAKDILIDTKGKYSSFGITGVESEINLKTNSGNIIIKSENLDDGQYADGGAGLYLQDVKGTLTSGEDILISSIGKELSYGIASLKWSNRTTPLLKIEAEKDIILSSKAEGDSYGAYLMGETTISGNNVGIVSESNGKKSYGLYSISSTNIEAENNISIESTANNTAYGIIGTDSDINLTSNLGTLGIYAKSEEGNSYTAYVKNGNTTFSGNSVDIISESNGNSSYGLYFDSGIAEILSKDTITVNSTSNNNKSYATCFTGTEVDMISNNDILLKNTAKNISYGVYGTKSDINLTSNLGKLGIYTKSEEGNSYAAYVKNGNTTFSGNSMEIVSESEREAYGILSENNNLDITGDTFIKVSGEEIGQAKFNRLTDEQKEIAKKALENGNNTMTKIFTDSKLVTGAVTQGVRAKNSEVNFNGNLRVESSDTAMTSIGEKASITVNGASVFKGNDYLVEQGQETTRIVARPVIQALDGGNITLNGETFISSLTSEKDEADRITNVGVYAHGTTELDKETGLSSEINLYGDATIVSDIALMATAGGHIHLNTEGESSQTTNEGYVIIEGDVVAGKMNSSIDIAGESVQINGEVIAGNGGTVTVDLTTGNSRFEGRADDYFNIEEDFDGPFRNEKFGMDIIETGTVIINMDNGAEWDVKGQSYITNLNFGKKGGEIILNEPDGNNSTISIEKISGSGTFSINLNAAEKEKGAMIYIYGTEEENLQHTVKLDITKIEEFGVGEEIRFATLGVEARKSHMSFVVEDIKEEGIKDVEFVTGNEGYDLEDGDNVIYNGDEATENKPGDEIIDENYKDGENWFLTRKEPSDKVNDIGTTIIEMSKANYAGAVYMDNLNKRLGDMTFADGDEGLWVRLRNDRVGEDNEYRLINYMTQLGYMKKSYDENGTIYRGIAGEITRGDMEFKNITGDATIDRHSISLYDTKLYNNGFYHDYVAKVGRLENDFDIQGRETGNKAEGNYKNLFVGVSAEYGYRHNINNNWYVEPQGQLQYTYIDDTDYTTNQDTKVKLEDIHSLIGRVGFRLGYNRYSEDKKVSTFYVKADVNHEFAGDQKVEAKDKTGSINKKYDNSKTWYDVGVGITSKVNESMDVYADIEKQFGSERDSKSWQFNMGFKYKF